MPARIQRSRARGWRMPEGAVYVGRPTMWGNPFSHRLPRVAAGMYRAWLVGSVRTADMLECRAVVPARFLPSMRADALAQMSDLRGRTLACWCRLDQPCHADVLLELANA